MLRQENGARGAAQDEGSHIAPGPQRHTANTHCAGKATPPAASQCLYIPDTEALSPSSSCLTVKKGRKYNIIFYTDCIYIIYLETICDCTSFIKHSETLYQSTLSLFNVSKELHPS